MLSRNKLEAQAVKMRVLILALYGLGMNPMYFIRRIGINPPLIMSIWFSQVTIGHVRAKYAWVNSSRGRSIYFSLFFTTHLKIPWAAASNSATDQPSSSCPAQNYSAQSEAGRQDLQYLSLCHGRSEGAGAREVVDIFPSFQVGEDVNAPQKRSSAAFSIKKALTAKSHKCLISLVGRRGIEPLTYWLRVSCSPSWANGPCVGNSLTQFRVMSSVFWQGFKTVLPVTLF